MRNERQSRITYLRGYRPKPLDRNVCRLSTGMMMAKRGSLNVRFFYLASGWLMLAVSFSHCLHFHLVGTVCLNSMERTGSIAVGG
jgi:hypothetical protein